MSDYDNNTDLLVEAERTVAHLAARCRSLEEALRHIRLMALNETGNVRGRIAERAARAVSPDSAVPREAFGTCSRCDDGRRPCVCGERAAGAPRVEAGTSEREKS